MHEDRKAKSAGAADQGSKRRWSTPTLARIEAAEAETGTRTLDDGPFTTS